MARHPVLITSLEDDFKKIGLIAEDKNTDNETVDAIDESDLDEAAGRRVRGKRTKKMSAKARRAKKQWRRTSGGKASGRKARMKSRKPKAKRMRAKAKKKYGRFYQKNDIENNDSLSNLIGEVASLVQAVEGGDDNVEANEAIKSWANMAIISEMLGNFFGSISEEEDDTELEAAFGEAAETFSDLAESAAEHARGLSEGRLDEDDEDLQSVFSEHMATLLSGLELYSDIVEEDEEDEEDPSED